ncbi:TIGR03936 family radical SAM-associated protein [Streptomyces sp. SID3343]|uniref:TIGR03936 family radical SAM-associated protein n=1 Tax=Streptomyces sp. SID3343 TaxID=2690260 RepID=UPI0019258A7C|nr:TIGR03936 family radical SAM-associated protein [Streptomyces sp. SID3343]
MKYTKRGRLRFSSHRDFQRAFERALRRAAVPMAYSAGFTPHPKVSYAGAAPTGVASEAEYLEISVATRCDPADLRELLDSSLPTGLDIVEIVEAHGGNLPERLQASIWELALSGVTTEEAGRAVTAFLAAEEVEVGRMTKNGLRTFDARAAVVDLTVTTPDGNDAGHQGVDAKSGSPCAILRLVVRHTTPAVRPDDVLSGLRLVAELVTPTAAAVTRLAQGPLDTATNTVTDPLAPDRAVLAVELSSQGDEDLRTGPQGGAEPVVEASNR